MVLKYRAFAKRSLFAAIAGSLMLGQMSAARATTSAQIYSGAEGSVGANNTSTGGGAIEGTVASSGDTAFSMPFGVLGEYLASPSVFGIGAAGISTSGYAIGAEVLGSDPALYALSSGIGPAVQAVTDADATGVVINSQYGNGLQAEAQKGGYGLQITSQSGLALQASGPDGAGGFSSSASSAGVADVQGRGVSASGYDSTTKHLPALLAQSNTTASDIFTGYNQTTALVFTIAPQSESRSGLAPATGSEVDMQGDLYVTGGLYECLPNSGGCSTIGATAPSVADTRTREGVAVRTFVSNSTKNTVEDFGEGRLASGVADVRLDPAIVDLLGGRSAYVVFVTAGGDNRGLYVANRSPLGFEIREAGGGRSNLSFAYRIVVARTNGVATPGIRTTEKTFAPKIRSASGVRIAVAPAHVAPTLPISKSFVGKLLSRRAAISAPQRQGSAQSVTGAEGAIAYNNTSTSGAALLGTVASAGKTSESIPFGVFGDYYASNSTFGVGVMGISKSGYGVAGEALGSNVAVLGLSNVDGGSGMLIATTSVGQGLQVQSKGAGLVSTVAGAGDGIFAAATGGSNAINATSMTGTAATFVSTNVKGGMQGGGGQATLGSSGGTGVTALGYDNTNEYAALTANANESSDVFDGYNAASSSAVFQINGTSANASGLTQQNASDVSTYGDFLVHGGIFQCTTGGTCTAITAANAAAVQRQSQPSVEDFGEAKLMGGHAYVPLDRHFSDTMSAATPYLVFLTPNGDGNDLYFSNRSDSGFTVTESRGGRSNLSFSYRIVANPTGARGTRFPAIREIEGPLPKPRIAGLHAFPRDVRSKPAAVHPLIGGR